MVGGITKLIISKRSPITIISWVALGFSSIANVTTREYYTLLSSIVTVTSITVVIIIIKLVTNYGAIENITTTIKETTMYTILNATSKVAAATYQIVTVAIIKNIKPR